MSVKQHVNDDEIEIHELPEIATLPEGMMVAVDSQPTGTKSFNLTTALEGKASASDVTDLATAVAGKAEASDLTALATTVEGKADASDVNTALESKANTSDLSTKADTSTVTALSNEMANKVDLPATTPVKGQVLQFNGTANEWNRLITGTRFDSIVYPEQAINVKFNTTCYGNPSDHDSNSEVTSVQGVMTSADGQSTVNIQGCLLPFNLGSGYLHSWTNARGTHLGWSSINEVPSSTSTDSGKVLKVGSTGTPSWGNEIFIATYNVTSFADILAAKNRGEIIMLIMPAPQNMHGPLLSLFNMTDTVAYFTAVAPGTTSSPSNLWTVEVSTDGTTDTWSSPIVNNCAQLGSMTIETDSSPVIISVLNNCFGTMSLNRSSFTLIVEVNDGEVINFALEIENSQSCQLTIQKKVGNTTTTLKHSVAGGNTLDANKTYQVTAVGNCWTLAEFES